MTQKTILLFSILIIGLIILLIFVRNASEPREATGKYWSGTDIACLIFGHQNLALHIHPELAITVDGIKEQIPANIGLSENCMAEVHIHDATGQIHIESAVQGKIFTLSDLFAVWGESIEREGYTHQVFANGTPIDPATYELKDLDQIEVQYTSLGREPQESQRPTSPVDTQVDFNIAL